MNTRQSDAATRVQVVTHIHTSASNGEASELDQRISGAMHRIDPGTRMTWAECFTPVEALERLLQRGRGEHGPVHQIFITDHMRLRAHRLPGAHLAAAARDRRLALGAELATRTRDVDGEYHQGPEILAYGGPEPVEGPCGPYYGLSQDLLDELYATCLADDGLQLCTRRARRLLDRRRVVHGLSHPFDGHDLSLEGTLAIIGEFQFVETVNGGYPARSALMLDALIALNNALLAGASLSPDELTPLGRRVVDRIRHRGRWTWPLGGSDAHNSSFDRVITSFAMPGHLRPEAVTPGEILARMLALADGRFSGQPAGQLEPRGAAVTREALLSDVVTIVLKNIWLNLPRCRNPLTWAKFIPATCWITRDELRKRDRFQRRRMEALRTEFNPIELLSRIVVPDDLVVLQAKTSPLRPCVTTTTAADARRRRRTGRRAVASAPGTASQRL